MRGKNHKILHCSFSRRTHRDHPLVGRSVPNGTTFTVCSIPRIFLTSDIDTNGVRSFGTSISTTAGKFRRECDASPLLIPFVATRATRKEDSRHDRVRISIAIITCAFAMLSRLELLACFVLLVSLCHPACSEPFQCLGYVDYPSRRRQVSVEPRERPRCFERYWTCPLVN